MNGYAHLVVDYRASDVGGQARVVDGMSVVVRCIYFCGEAASADGQRAESVAEVLVERSKWDMNERNRVLAALEVAGWRRQDTAAYLGISRKVLWEKTRKFQIFDEEPETRTVG
jgi:DNA-binding NtrC family response regulator